MRRQLNNSVKPHLHDAAATSYDWTIDLMDLPLPIIISLGDAAGFSSRAAKP